MTPLSQAEHAERLAAIQIGLRDAPRSPFAHAAAILGNVSCGTLAQWWRKHEGRDTAIQAAMTAVKTDMVPALAWAKTKPDADGNSYSVLLKPEAAGGQTLAESVRAALEDLPPVQPVAAPLAVDDDLTTVIPIADAHIGMMAWGEETGEDYDTKIGVNRLMSWVGRCIEAAPASGHAIILDVGDLTHADNQDNRTRASGHILDVDTRHFKTIMATVAALVYAVDYALRKHRRVTVKIIPGNHNPDSYVGVLVGLVGHYRLEPRVKIQAKPGEYFAHKFGDCLIAAHHGHRAKPDRMVMFLADEYAELWGSTRHRFLFTGHMHHHKSADIGGVRWEQLRALTARDAYSVGSAYLARSELQAITYHRTRGEIQRVRVGV